MTVVPPGAAGGPPATAVPAPSPHGASSYPATLNAADPPPAEGAARWSDGTLAAALLAVDPAGLGGAVVHAFPGPVRDRWLREFRHLCPGNQRFLPHQDDASLLGGLDVAATLQAGRPCLHAGVLAASDGGALVVPMAERLSARQAAHIGAVLDTGQVVIERDGFARVAPARLGVVLFDESLDPEDACPGILLERCAFRIDLSTVALADLAAAPYGPDAVATARRRLDSVTVPDAALEALCASAERLGLGSLRLPTLALRAARAAAALLGAREVDATQAALAVRLVFGPRASPAPQPPPPQDDDKGADGEPESRDEPSSAETIDPDDLTEILVAAALDAARVPLSLTAPVPTAKTRQQGPAGRCGPVRHSTLRGRPAGARPGSPGNGARLDLLATLRAAAPWQPVRRRGSAVDRQISIKREDLHVRRFRQRAATLTIFVVDASGSAAMQRLGEAKGAVELLLGDCYVRRDSVALVSFRGRAAEVLLEPTRSLVRAKRALAHLVGGGATPLAAGVDAAVALALRARRRGIVPGLVVLTDGRANVARDGTAEREAARADAVSAAARLGGLDLAAMLVDVSPRGQAFARELAETAGAAYVALPQADARRLSNTARALTAGSARHAG